MDRVIAGSAFLQPRLCRLMSLGHSVNSYEKSVDPAEESLRRRDRKIERGTTGTMDACGHHHW